MVIKKKDGKDYEVQEGWIGYILPFKLVQERLLPKKLKFLQDKEQAVVETSSEIETLIDSFTEEEKDRPFLNDANNAFVIAELSKALKEVYRDIETPEISALNGYLALLDNKAKKPEKEAYIQSNSNVKWAEMQESKGGTYSKTVVNNYLKKIQSVFAFPEESFEAKLVQADALITQEKALKAQIKEEADALHNLTKRTIEQLDDQAVLRLLEAKWVEPIVNKIALLPDEVIKQLTTHVQKLADKYAQTFTETADQLNQAENTLADLMDELTANEFDQKGIAQLQLLLREK